MQKILFLWTQGGLETAFRTQLQKMKWPHMLGLILLTLRMLNWAPAFMRKVEADDLLRGCTKTQMGIGTGRAGIGHIRF